MLGNILLWISNKKNRSCFEQSSGICFCSWMMMMMLLLMILAQTVFVYLCICVFVFVYFDVRHLGTLFLRSSNNILFKNIAYDRSISKFYPNCICVFVYLCICICVFGHPRLISDQLELFVTSPFSSTFLLGHSKWPKKCWKHFPIEQVLFYISPPNRYVIMTGPLSKEMLSLSIKNSLFTKNVQNGNQ